MWADTLLAAERAHLFRLIAWGAASVLAGTALVAMLRVRHRRSALLERFGQMTAFCGVAELAFAAARLATLQPRDLGAATRLDRLLWLSVGFDVGLALVGATLAVAGWRLGRRLAWVGAGTALIVQSVALMWISALLASRISR